VESPIEHGDGQNDIKNDLRKLEQLWGEKLRRYAELLASYCDALAQKSTVIFEEGFA
jgi:hypothetical protein